MSSLKQRTGYSLIEVLVVIAVAGVLVALLVPAVQKVRESANRTNCANNLRQIALAANNYASTHEALPSGLDQQHVASLVYLMPYLELTTVYDNFSLAPNPPNAADPTYQYGQLHAFWWDNNDNTPPPSGPSRGVPAGVSDPIAWLKAGNTYANWVPYPVVPQPASTIPRPPDPYGRALFGIEPRIKLFQCPSAPDPTACTNMIRCMAFGEPGVDYSPWFLPGYGGSTHFAGMPERLLKGTTNYVGCAGDFFTSPPLYRGVFTYNSRMSLQKVPDGVSNTMMFMEYAGGWVDFGDPSQDATNPPGWAGLFWAGAMQYTTWGTCPNASCPTCCDPLGPPTLGMFVNSANSFHNVIQVAMCDGSVRGFRGDVDYKLWLALGGYQDGESVVLDQ
jgi:prepilin-type N-terminal cleavage/methylation domain-containing protein